jgi:hypothetical protein
MVHLGVSEENHKKNKNKNKKKTIWKNTVAINNVLKKKNLQN